MNAGFSSASSEKLYIPLDYSENRPDAESQMANTSSIYYEVKRLIALRQNNIALQSNAKITWICDDYPMVYIRECEKQRVMVVINPSINNSEIPCKANSIIYTLGISSLYADKLYVGGCSAVILKL